MKRFSACALLLSLTACSRGTDGLSSVSGESAMLPDATAGSGSTMPADAAPTPNDAPTDAPIATTPTTTSTLETVQTLVFGEPTYGEEFTDPVTTEPTPTCYTYAGSGGEFTSCDGPAQPPPPAEKWVTFSIDDTFE